MSPRGLGLAQIVAGTLVVVGLGFRLAPAEVTLPSLPAAPAAAVDSAPAASDSGGSLADRIVQRNPFSPDRAAPAVPRPKPRPDTTHRRPALRLVGTLQTPDGKVALIDADPAAPGAEMYRPGDRVGDARLVEVNDSSVVLNGPSGRRVLRLP